MIVRNLRPADLDHAGAVLHAAFASVAEEHGYRPPWPDEQRARALLEEYARPDIGDVLVAEEGGVVIGVGAVRIRGEVASIGPIATFVAGRGVGSAVLDGLLSRADDRGALATRLYVDGWNPSAYALYAGRGFGVVDVVAHIERPPGPGPQLGNSRGLEVRPFEDRDLDELSRFDTKLTGHDRRLDLRACVRLVARRRGALVGYLGATRDVQADTARASLGPALAVDASDLVTLVANALLTTDSGAPWMAGNPVLRARLSTSATSAPAVSMAALGMGFQIREIGIVMSRGAPPPTRSPQLYGLHPELL